MKQSQFRTELLQSPPNQYFEYNVITVENLNSTKFISSPVDSHRRKELTTKKYLILWQLLCSLYFAPILFAIPGDRTPNLTTITVTTNHYTPYPMQCHRSRLSHSLMAVRLMFTLGQILHHAYRTASYLGASCISSPLYDPYLASCSSHVFLMTRTRPIGYDPLI